VYNYLHVQNLGGPYGPSIGSYVQFNVWHLNVCINFVKSWGSGLARLEIVAAALLLDADHPEIDAIMLKYRSEGQQLRSGVIAPTF